MGVFDMDEVNEFIDLYIRGEEADKWAPIIDVAAQRFNLEIEWAENGKADFKMKCKQFVKYNPQNQKSRFQKRKIKKNGKRFVDSLYSLIDLKTI